MPDLPVRFIKLTAIYSYRMWCLRYGRTHPRRRVHLQIPRTQFLLHTGPIGVVSDDMPEQLIPGHEAIGTVVEMGKDVKGFDMGDRCVADVGETVSSFLQTLRSIQYF